MGKLENLVELVDFSSVPQEEIILSDRCKKARLEWWRSRLNYDAFTDDVVRSMKYQNKLLEEIKCYIKTRNENFLKNCPYPVDEICYRSYTDYVPF